MKFVKYFFVVFLLSALIIWLGIKDALNPVQRTDINQSIFTIGDANYQQALSDGKNIVKFGQMFWGLYPGGLAFSTPSEALAFTRANQNALDKFSSGWAIYELSGDLDQDTYLKGNKRYLNKSLLVVKQVSKP